MRLAPLLTLPLLAACVTTDGAQSAANCPETRGWAAWINDMPGPGATPTLIVAGEAKLPAGTVAILTPGPTDRMMPPGQRFTLVLRKGSGPGGWQPVRGEIKPALPDYREVIVGCGGAIVARISPIEKAV
ncbi:MAG TPA: hypothetical protein VHG29_05545 [Novosphingobium sp.]|nr:hypothetical protein [Novosphingobium sp.]